MALLGDKGGVYNSDTLIMSSGTDNPTLPGEKRRMLSKPSLITVRPNVRTALLAAAFAIVLPSCVNLTPPWNGKTGTGGTTIDGTGGALPIGGGGASGSGGAGGRIGDADVPSDGAADVNSQPSDGPADGIPFADVADVPLGGSGGSGLDSGVDHPGSGGAGGTTSRGGAGGSGGIASAGGAGGKTTSTGGKVGTGGSGTGGSPPIDAGSVCTGRTTPGVAADGGLKEGLVAYYACDETTGSTLSDQSGNSNNAALVTGGTGSGYAFNTGKIGGAVFLTTAQKGYASLPSGLLANVCDVTIATWVYVNTNPIWQRVFDFGKDTTTYMFVSPKNGMTNVVRFAITVNTNADEQYVDGSAELPTKAWSHVAIVLGPAGGSLYVNGSLVGSNPDLTLRPADLGTPLNYYIGRSQFSPDPYLDGNIDDFRVYSRALSAAEIQALAAM